MSGMDLRAQLAQQLLAATPQLGAAPDGGSGPAILDSVRLNKGLAPTSRLRAWMFTWASRRQRRIRRPGGDRAIHRKGERMKGSIETRL